jgi:hypothetical protein
MSARVEEAGGLAYREFEVDHVRSRNLEDSAQLRLCPDGAEHACARAENECRLTLK